MATMPNPWLGDAESDPEPIPFRLDEILFMQAVDFPVEHAVWSPAEDPPPLFISDPSPEFIAAMHRDVMPLLERAARLA